MAFRLADVKKIVRSRSDGERYLHPKLLDEDVANAQVSLALGYFHARLGRARREIDPELLVRFFGDPKVARGLVYCLGTTYRWRTQDFAEVLDARTVVSLARRRIHTPSDLRLHLFDAVNAQGHGYLPAEREQHLEPLARGLRLAPAKLDQLVALDAEENAVLVRIGPGLEPWQVVAMYNFHVIDALLRNSVTIDLTGLREGASCALAAAADALGVAWSRETDGIRLYNRADSFGSYARSGQRLSRALYAAASSEPSLLRGGRARVQVPGKAAWYLFDRHTAHALTANTGIVRYAVAPIGFADAWQRQRTSGGTGGWRLLTAPEPAVSAAGLVLAPFACRRDETQIWLWPVDSLGALSDLLAVHAAGMDVLALISDDMAAAVPPGLAWVSASEGATGIVAALSAHWGGGRVDAGEQALESLLEVVHTRGFIPEPEVADALGCASIRELATRLTSLDAERGVYVPGLGLCSALFAETMRRGLRRKPARTPAA